MNSERNSPVRQPRVLTDLPEWETPRRGGEINESKLKELLVILWLFNFFMPVF